MKRFFKDIKKYKNYIIYATWSELKAEVINSYLGFLWMILEPLAFMLIYTFIAIVVFNSSVEYFPIFVFIGLSIWNFFNKMVTVSVKLVTNNRDTVTKVYLPKFVLILIKMGVNLFKMLISFLLVFIFMIIYKVPITWNVLWFIPILITVIIFTFGVCTFVLHVGVFAEDLSNLVNIGLRFLFYLTGVFFDLSTKIHDVTYRTILLDLNPLANLIYNMRNVLIYQSSIVGIWTFIWFVVGIFLSYLGIKTIYKYENTYVKVMR
ncbi:MAG: ABC transporter permease [bacterium]|nr:ABC transporter permease [bacterium]